MSVDQRFTPTLFQQKNIRFVGSEVYAKNKNQR